MSTNRIYDRASKTEIPRLLLTAREAAVMLSMSPRKLWSLTNSNEFPHIRIGRSVRYRVADIEEWIEQQRSEPPARKGSHGKSARRTANQTISQ